MPIKNKLRSPSRYIPNRLRRYRKERGLSQKDVARLLKLESTSMLSRWEQGRCLPSTMNLFRLAAVYNTLVDALYRDLFLMIRREFQSGGFEPLS